MLKNASNNYAMNKIKKFLILRLGKANVSMICIILTKTLSALRSFHQSHHALYDCLESVLYLRLISAEKSVHKVKPFITKSQLFTTVRKKAFENIVGKGENAGNQHFLLFP